MPGVITDLIDRVSDSSTGRPIIANLAAPGKAIGAASINLDAATNWTTSSAIHFSIYETTTVGSTVVKNPSTQTDWKGTLSGVAVGNLTLTGGTDRAYTAGAKVEITPTARYAKDLYDWAMTGHNQNGTHKAFTESSIVPTAALQDSAVTTAKIAADAVDATKIDFSTLPRAKASRSTSLTVSNTTGTLTDLPLTTTEIDVGGFTLASGGLTIPADGDYLIAAEARATDAENFLVAMYHNTNVAAQLSFRATTSTSRGYQTSTGSTMRTCVAGDVIKLRYENRNFATSVYYAQMTILRVG